jgi:hypothetical protein
VVVSEGIHSKLAVKNIYIFNLYFFEFSIISNLYFFELFESISDLYFFDELFDHHSTHLYRAPLPRYVELVLGPTG